MYIVGARRDLPHIDRLRPVAISANAPVGVAGEQDFSAVDGGSTFARSEQREVKYAAGRYLPRVDGLRTVAEGSNDGCIKGKGIDTAEIDDRAVDTSSSEGRR